MKAQWKLTGSPSIPHVSSCKVMYFRYNYDWCIIGFFLISAHWFSQVTLSNFDPQASASQQQFEERRFHLVLANPRPRGTAEPRGFWPPGRIQSLQSFRKWWGKKHKRFIIIVQKTYWNSHFGVIIIYLLPDKLVQVGILSGEYWRISIWKWNGKEMDLELELGWWVLIFWVNSARKNTTDESADIEIFWLLARLYRSNPPMATFKQYTAMGWYGCGQNSMSMTLWPEDFGRVHPQPSPFKFSSLCR